jgi:hypothetical protein
MKFTNIRIQFPLLQHGDGPSEMKIFLMSILTDVMDASWQMLMWCLTQNGQVMSILTTLETKALKIHDVTMFDFNISIHDVLGLTSLMDYICE